MVADPSLRDSIFHKSVVLLAQHSTAEGAFGLILNQPSEYTVGDMLKDESLSPLARIPVFVGGPVAREHLTFVVFSLSENNQLEYSIRISAEEAIERSQQSGVLVRAFSGYAGWNPGQLEEELDRNSWVTSPAPTDFLGKTHDVSLWGDTLKSLSPFHRLLSLCPTDPWLN